MGDVLALGEVALDDLEGLDKMATDYENRGSELIRKAQAVREIIAAVHKLNGDAPAVLRRSFQSHRVDFELGPADESGPRGKSAVLRVMAEHPERSWKVVDLKREILRRGWAPTPKAVEASLKRLRELGEIENPEYGFYRLKGESPERQEVILSVA